MRGGEFFWTEEQLVAPGERGEEGESRNFVGVQYKFYKKPMATKIGILARSAMMDNTKITTASAELTRRWKNTSEFCEKQVFERITKEYMDDLKGMGYGDGWRERVLMGAITGYCRTLAKVEMGIVRRNRPGVSTLTNRRHKKLLGQSTWFKIRKEERKESQGKKKEKVRNVEDTVEEKDTREFQNVMFIPYRKGSELRKKLQAMEDSMKFRRGLNSSRRRAPTWEQN